MHYSVLVKITRLTYALCVIRAAIPCYGTCHRPMHERDDFTPSITEHTSYYNNEHLKTSV